MCRSNARLRVLNFINYEEFYKQLISDPASTQRTQASISAAGEPILVVGQVDHQFVAVPLLITPVILGMDFFARIWDGAEFQTTPVTIHNTNPPTNVSPELKPILEMARNTTRNICAVASLAESSEDIINNCAVLLFVAVLTYDMPNAKIQILLLFLRNTENYFVTHQARQM